MNLADVMDEIAERIRQAPSLAGGRTHAYPPGELTAPAAVVTYPTDYAYDATYGRGTDTMTGRIVVVVGGPTDRQSRNLLTKYVDGSGPESIKSLVDGDGDYASCDSVTVTSVEIGVDQSFADIEYLAAVFSLDIVGPGTA